MITPIPLLNGFYQSESLPVSSQQCLNMYVNIPDNQGITEAQLYQSPGLIEAADTGENQVNRGIELLNEVPYFINGDEFVRLNDDESVTVLGNIAGTGKVSTAQNGTQIIIVVPGTGIGYIYTEMGGLVTITDPDFNAHGPPEIVVFIDGYFVLSTASRTFFISNLNDGLNYDALDFGSAEADPDIIRSLFVYKSQLYVFGSLTIEVFNNVGGAGFPFQRIQGFVIPKGITAPFSVTAFAGTFVWIGAGVNETPRVYRFTGNDAEEISTTSINFILQTQAPQVEDAEVFNFTFRGAIWVGWSGDFGTFIFDQKASSLGGKMIWHERVSETLQQKVRWRGTKVITAYDNLYTGDTERGYIGRISESTFTEYGINIKRRFSLPTMLNNTEPQFHHWFKLLVDGGQGQAMAPGDDPTISMEYSDDARYYKIKGARRIGKQGQYNTKVKWSQLGYTERYRIYQFSFQDPARLVVMGAYLSHD